MRWLFKKTTDLSEEEYAAVYEGLSSSRKAHIDQMKQEEDKKRSLLASALVAELLQAEGVAAKLENDADGRPFLRGSDLFVSISHSHQGVACAIDHQPVGIDLEQIRPVRKSLVEYVCLPEELAYVIQSPQPDTVTDPDTLQRFFQVWTAKEACFKKHRDLVLLKINTLPLETTLCITDGFFINII